LQYNTRDRIKNLDLEAKNLLNFVPTEEEDFLRCLAARNIEILSKNQTKQNSQKNLNVKTENQTKEKYECKCG
jgi:hypothetical protein